MLSFRQPCSTQTPFPISISSAGDGAAGYLVLITRKNPFYSASGWVLRPSKDWVMSRAVSWTMYLYILRMIATPSNAPRSFGTLNFRLVSISAPTALPLRRTSYPPRMLSQAPAVFSGERTHRGNQLMHRAPVPRTCEPATDTGGLKLT